MAAEVWFDDKSVGVGGDIFKPSGAGVWRVYILPKAAKKSSLSEEDLAVLESKKSSGLVEEVEFSDGAYILWWTVVGDKVHYMEKMNRYVLCLSTDDNVAACCKYDSKDPAWYGAMPVLVYLTQRDGSPLEQPAMSIKNASVLTWKVTEAKFGQIRTEHKMQPIPVHDFIVTGKPKGRFTDLTIRAVSPALVRKSSKAFEAFVKKAQPMWKTIPSRLGRKMTEEEIEEELGVVSASSSSGLEFDDVSLDVDL